MAQSAGVKVTSIEKVTSILELFLNAGAELSLSEMARLTGLHKSTVNRIASFLVKESYLEQREKRGKYSLGMKFLDYSAVIKSRIKIRDVAMRYLDQLKHAVEESCIFMMFDGKRAIVIDTVDYDSILKASPTAMSKPPLHATSGGKVFLTSLSDMELRKYFDKAKLEKFTDRTITDRNKLRAGVEQVRKQGYASDIDEHITGISSLAVPIRDAGEGIVGAVAVIGPTARMTNRRIKAIIPPLLKTANDISRWAGWRGS
jgi:IclR family transcriptional regulator, KDG regulon repressor